MKTFNTTSLYYFLVFLFLFIHFRIMTPTKKKHEIFEKNMGDLHPPREDRGEGWEEEAGRERRLLELLLVGLFHLLQFLLH